MSDNRVEIWEQIDLEAGLISTGRTVDLHIDGSNGKHFQFELTQRESGKRAIARFRLTPEVAKQLMTYLNGVISGQVTTTSTVKESKL